MKNTNIILKSEEYQRELKEIESKEEDRIFCKHDLEHYLDVARIMEIYNLEENLGFSRDLIYSAALLHDIGRAAEYRGGPDHNVASYDFSLDILEKTDFSEEEKATILEAILEHREKSETSTFAKYFYKADKASRSCHNCPAWDMCNWSYEKKNKEIII